MEKINLISVWYSEEQMISLEDYTRHILVETQLEKPILLQEISLYNQDTTYERFMDDLRHC